LLETISHRLTFRAVNHQMFSSLRSRAKSTHLLGCGFFNIFLR